MQLTLSKAQYFLKDELKAVREYKKYGLFELAEDEQKHANFFKRLLKEGR